jgi:drug/metabolite transporter (DMT)-like permease
VTAEAAAGAPAADDGGRALPRLQVLAAALLFSTGGAAIKASTLDAWQVASFRSGVAALVLLGVVPAARRAALAPRALLVGLAYAATMVLFVAGNKLTTAANTIFLQSTAPLYLVLLGPWLLGERTRARDVVMLAVMIFGLALFFVGEEQPQLTAPSPLAGNLLAVAAGFGWALTIVGLRWIGRDGAAEGVLGAVVAGNLVACFSCLPFALPIASAHPRDLVLILYLGAFQIALAYLALARGVRHVSALGVSLLLLLEPVLSVVWAWLVHGERPGPWSLAGCLVIFGATVARVMAPSAPRSA